MKILNLFLLYLLFPIYTFSQLEDPPITNIELTIHNSSTLNNTSIKCKIYPVSMVFNGWKQYDLKAQNDSYPDPYTTDYGFINGRNVNINEFLLAPNQSIGFNHDNSSYYSGTEGCIGYGVYKIEIRNNSNNNLIDTCTVEYDAGYPGVGLNADLDIFYRNDINGIGGSGSRVTFTWNGVCLEQNISVINKKIEAWNQCTNQSRSKQKEGMIYSTSNGNDYITFPQDFRQDCGDENYPYTEVNKRVGLLTQNLTISKNVRTKLSTIEGERIDTPTAIIISPECSLRVSSNCTLSVKYDPDFVSDPAMHNKFTIMDVGVLHLYSGNANVIFENSNWLTINCNSIIEIESGSKLTMETGSKFCNRGGIIRGQGSFVIQGLVKYPNCNISPCRDNMITDSLKFIIENSSEFEIPDSTNYIFEGTQTALFCKRQLNYQIWQRLKADIPGWRKN